MSINYLVCGDYVVTMNANLDVIANGAVAVLGNKIVDVAPQKILFKQYPNTPIIGGQGHVVLPGLINTHNHAAMVYFRGIADDIPLQIWLEQYIWPAEKKWLNEEFVHDATQLACLEMLKGGTTNFADMYFYGHDIAAATKSIGLRATIGNAIFDFPTQVAKNPDEYLTQTEDFILQWKNDALITPSVAPHATYTCSAATLKKAKVLAEKYDIQLQIHVAETAEEIEDIRKKFNKTPISHLEACGLLDEHTIAAHCVWCDDADIALLAKHRVNVVHCIESELKLASGIAPIAQMLKAQINVAFGTDGAASNNDLNMFSEISTAAKVHKSINKDPTILNAKSALLMATRNGAQALGLQNLGFLAKNAVADLITLNLTQPHLVPIYDIYSHLVYAAQASDVANVLVNGQLLLQDSIPLTCDQHAIIEKAKYWNNLIKHNTKKKNR
ncbi:5-methylthioadenosine/S-adenosylhomocysteine deaminase [Gammaproteobacteria bacterium]